MADSVPAFGRDEGVRPDGLPAPPEGARPPVRVGWWRFPATLAAAMLAPVVLGLALVGGWAYARFGTLGVTAAFLRGETLVLEPTVIDMGTLHPGEVKESRLWAYNMTGEEFRINGALNYCAEKACVGIEDQRFPLVIPPWSRREVVAVIAANPPERLREGPFRYMTSLHTQGGGRSIAITGRVSGARAPSDAPKK